MRTRYLCCENSWGKWVWISLSFGGVDKLFAEAFVGYLADLAPSQTAH